MVAEDEKGKRKKRRKREGKETRRNEEKLLSAYSSDTVNKDGREMCNELNGDLLSKRERERRGKRIFGITFTMALWRINSEVFHVRLTN